MEILGDDKMMSAFRQSVKEEMEGRGIPWDKVKRKLKL